MAGLEVIWSDRAKRELRKTLLFFNERHGNTNYSKKLLSEIDDRIFSLFENPLLGRPTTSENVRVLVHQVYLIFYEIDDTQIKILSFWDNRRNPKESLIS